MSRRVGLLALALAVTAAVIAPAAHAYIYESLGAGGEGSKPERVARFELDGSGQNLSFIGPNPSGTVPLGLAVTPSHIYWANVAADAIGRAKIDGSNVEPNFIKVNAGGDAFPLSVAVDNDRVYWTVPQQNKIGKAQLDGDAVNRNWVTGLPLPWSVASSGTHVYWTQLSGGIGRVAADGTKIEKGFLNVLNPYGIAVDDEHLYWTHGDKAGFIGMSNRNGNNVNGRLFETASFPRAIAVLGKKLYWTYGRGPAVGRGNTDGSGREQPFLSPNAGRFDDPGPQAGLVADHKGPG